MSHLYRYKTLAQEGHSKIRSHQRTLLPRRLTQKAAMDRVDILLQYVARFTEIPEFKSTAKAAINAAIALAPQTRADVEVFLEVRTKGSLLLVKSP